MDVTAPVFTSIARVIAVLFLTVHELRASPLHNKLSVRPYLHGCSHKEINGTEFTGSHCMSSHGIGPPRIREFMISRGWKRCECGKGDYVENCLRAPFGKSLKYQIKRASSSGSKSSLLTGESLCVAEIYSPAVTPGQEGPMLELLKGLELRVAYEPFYGEKDVWDARDRENKWG